MSEKQDFKIDSIKRIIYKIRNSNIKNKEEYFSEQFPKFKENYPVLFEKVCNEMIDDNNLNFMLRMLQEIEDNKISQYDASGIVGTKLFNQFVDIDKIPKNKESESETEPELEN